MVSIHHQPLNATARVVSVGLLPAIEDPNRQTDHAAAVLFGVGSGPVRGFAVTLSIGIITTMFTAFTLTQLIVALWYSTRRPKEVPL